VLIDITSSPAADVAVAPEGWGSRHRRVPMVDVNVNFPDLPGSGQESREGWMGRAEHMSFSSVARQLLLTATAAAVLTTGLAVGAPGASAATGDGSPTDPNVTFFGRWDTTSATAYVSKWAGAYVKLGFTGTTVRLRQRGTIDFFASIDGGPDVSYVNASGTVNLTPTPLRAGNHTLRVSYRPVAGSYHGDAVYQGVTLDPGARTFAPPVSSKIIEFIGDSITVGQLSSKQALTAYGWLVGERLRVEHTQIAQGGACLVATADGCVGLSVQFLKTGSTADSPDWDFARYQASAVVINLGTNDVGHGVHTPQFQDTYVTLLQRVRAKYPNAVIFAMATFRKRFVTQTSNAVAIRNSAGDRNVQFVDTAGWIVDATDTVDGVHPNDAGHQKIAARLAPIISARIGTGP
jgi:lysophospholipase L1-like esterase